MSGEKIPCDASDPRDEWEGVPISSCTSIKDPQDRRAKKAYRDHILLGDLDKRLNTVAPSLHGARVLPLIPYG